jgi:methylenetetrahydrofolate reductase (NADPH)
VGLRESFNEKGFVVTAELHPPKGCELTGLLAQAAKLKGKVDALTVSDNAHAVMRMSPWAACSALQAKGFETVLTVACRDRNRLALASDLLAAASLGVRNLLCVSGDHVVLGDQPGAKPVFDLDSVQLLMLAAGLAEGQDGAGAALAGSPKDLLLGAALNPNADPPGPQLLKFRKKVEAGARFFQTQAVFEVGRFKTFAAEARKALNGTKVKVLAGVYLLSAEEVAKLGEAAKDPRLLPGLQVPAGLAAQLTAAPDKGAEVAGGIIKELKASGLCDGVHLMAGERNGQAAEAMLAALKAAGL